MARHANVARCHCRCFVFQILFQFLPVSVFCVENYTINTSEKNKIISMSRGPQAVRRLLDPSAQIMLVWQVRHLCHRIDGPAYETPRFVAWNHRNVSHRSDGPAHWKYWVVHGRRVRRGTARWHAQRAMHAVNPTVNVSSLAIAAGSESCPATCSVFPGGEGEGCCCSSSTSSPPAE